MLPITREVGDPHTARSDRLAAVANRSHITRRGGGSRPNHNDQGLRVLGDALKERGIMMSFPGALFCGRQTIKSGLRGRIDANVCSDPAFSFLPLSSLLLLLHHELFLPVQRCL